MLRILLALVHCLSDVRALRVGAEGLVARLPRRLKRPVVLSVAAVAAEDPDHHILVRACLFVGANRRPSDAATVPIEAAGHLARRALLRDLGGGQDATALRDELWLDPEALGDVGSPREGEDVDG